MEQAQSPEWVVPEGGITAADLDLMPWLPEHAELIDGGLFLPPPQRLFHLLMTQIVSAGLGEQRPTDLLVRTRMSVTLGFQQRLEPDVLVVHAAAETGLDQTWYPAGAVLLVVEVVSPESRLRDWDRKPQLYAEAGIQHFWRVDDEDGLPVVHVHELYPDRPDYALTGVHRGRLQVEVPYPVDLDLKTITAG